LIGHDASRFSHEVDFPPERRKMRTAEGRERERERETEREREKEREQ